MSHFERPVMPHNLYIASGLALLFVLSIVAASCSGPGTTPQPEPEAPQQAYRIQVHMTADQAEAEEVAFEPEEGERFRLSLSMGVAFFPRDASDAQSLLKRADEALYHAKSQGRDRVCFYDELKPSPADQGAD